MKSSLGMTGQRRSPALIRLLLIPIAAGFVAWVGTTWLNGYKTRKAQEAATDRAGSQRHNLTYMRILSLSGLFSEYADEHGGRLPPADRWEEALRPYALKGKENIAELVIRPLRSGQRRFAMNKALSGLNTRSLTGGQYARLILFFESTAPGPNAADRLASLPPAHADTEIAIMFLSGHPEFYRGPEVRPYGPGAPMSKLLPAIKLSHQIERASASRKQR